MGDGGGGGGGSIRVKHGSDAAEVTDVHEAGSGEVVDVVGEREMRIKSNSKIGDMGTEVKVVEEELLERCIEGSDFFLIWADRPIMMNSVLEWLRQMEVG